MTINPLTYVSWHQEKMMIEGDNPPVGIFLDPHKEYALAGMDNHLFVSRNLLDLPKKEEMQKFIDDQVWGVV